MPKITIVSGSPSHPSRSSAISGYLQKQLEEKGFQVNTVTVRDLPPEDVALANFGSTAVKEALQRIEEAEAVIVTGPVYKASYPGILKSFLDLIPEKGLTDKVLLPIATGGTIAHLLSLEYSIKPVFSVLGSNEILNGVFLVDKQFEYKGGLTFTDSQAEERLLASVKELAEKLKRKEQVNKAAKFLRMKPIKIQ